MLAYPDVEINVRPCFINCISGAWSDFGLNRLTVDVVRGLMCVVLTHFPR